MAVKQLKAKMIGNSLELKHFIAECAILRSLRHPNVVGCLGVGSLDSSSPEAELQTLYLVEEYVPGKTLRKLLLKEELSPWRTYSYGQAVDICADIASGLAYLHTLSPDKLVHRDIKPGNILLVARDKKGRIRNSSDGSHNHHHEDKPSKGGFQFHLPGHEKRHAIEYTAKIADFGLVKAIEMSRHGDDCAAQQQSGLICDLDESTHGGSSYEAHQGTGRTGSLLYMVRHRLSAPRSTHPVIAVDRDPINGCGPHATGIQIILCNSNSTASAESHHSAALSADPQAPEVYAAPWDRNPQMYNEKVDIYSLALILHEVFNRQAREPPPYSLRNSILIPEECERLAANAANGERPRIPRHWPAELSELIQECWHQEPERRPNAADVARRLEAMKPFIIERMDKTGLYTWFS